VEHFLSLADVSSAAFQSLLEQARDLKRHAQAGQFEQGLQGRVLGLIFEKASTRTRFSFESAMAELGGQSIFVDTGGKPLDHREPARDLARVYSGYCAGLVLRTHAHQVIVDMARHASIPVINGLSDDLHPCQALADALTIVEEFGQLEGLRVAYVGDANNVARSLAHACALGGATLHVASPPAYRFDSSFLEGLPRGTVEVTEDPAAAVDGAHVIYTDVWVSMGQEDEAAERRRVFAPYQVSETLMGAARDDAIFLHCLPAHRGEEVVDAVIEGKHSRVFQQAENRKHAQKAVLKQLLR
jgi:ornithine carbamoyltransferase